ncbi:CbtB domain-containing protein [Oceaniglobus roseus]|uniref:CbtB domain-containing protein n=1 Tax=Oceaniglobus roseus TaxID=1737570 RepID=UPI000C7F2F9E|nr:CbtB domain-containing protein [Kandeliimicrobium roseum]
MTTTTASRAVSTTPATILFALAAGVLLLAVSGMAQATVFHDAAHDQRHAMAFPCH